MSSTKPSNASTSWTTNLLPLRLKRLSRVKSTNSRTKQLLPTSNAIPAGSKRSQVASPEALSPGPPNMKQTNSRSFTLFPELPFEIQLTIWGFAAFLEPRIVNVIGVKISEDPDRIDPNMGSTLQPLPEKIYYIYAKTPFPSIFETCHNSREVALQNYKTSFEYSDTKWPHGGVRYNPVIDTLFFGTVDWSTFLHRNNVKAHNFHAFDHFITEENLEGDLAEIRHLAVGYKNLHQREYPGDAWNGTALLKYPNLETYYRIYYDTRPYYLERVNPNDNELDVHSAFPPNGHIQFEHVLGLETLNNDSGGDTTL